MQARVEFYSVNEVEKNVSLDINLFLQLSFEEMNSWFSGLIASDIKSLNLVDNYCFEYPDKYQVDETMPFPIFDAVMNWQEFCLQIARLKDSNIKSISMDCLSFPHLPAPCKAEFFQALNDSGIKQLTVSEPTMVDVHSNSWHYPEQYETFSQCLKYSGIVCLDLSSTSIYFAEDYGVLYFPAILTAINALKNQGFSLSLCLTFMTKDEWTMLFNALKDSSFVCMEIHIDSDSLDGPFFSEEVWPIFCEGISSTNILGTKIFEKRKHLSEEQSHQLNEVLNSNLVKRGLPPVSHPRTLPAFPFWQPYLAAVGNTQNEDAGMTLCTESMRSMSLKRPRG
jgi:hypothetical protein